MPATTVFGRLRSGIRVTALASLVCLSSGVAASASGWQHFGAVDQAGSRVSTAFADDPATGMRLGFSCGRRSLHAVASPVPQGATRSVEVEFSVGQWSRKRRWAIDGGHLIATGDVAKMLGESLLRGRDQVRVRMGQGAAATFATASAKQPAQVVLGDCGQRG